MDYRLYIDDIMDSINRIGTCFCEVEDEDKNTLEVGYRYGYVWVKVYKTKVRLRCGTGYKEVCGGGSSSIHEIACAVSKEVEEFFKCIKRQDELKAVRER